MSAILTLCQILSEVSWASMMGRMMNWSGSVWSGSSMVGSSMMCGFGIDRNTFILDISNKSSNMICVIGHNLDSAIRERNPKPQKMLNNIKHMMCSETQIDCHVQQMARQKCTLSVQLYSYVTSVNSVFVSDKIINNSDKFRLSAYLTVK